MAFQRVHRLLRACFSPNGGCRRRSEVGQSILRLEHPLSTTRTSRPTLIHVTATSSPQSLKKSAVIRGRNLQHSPPPFPPPAPSLSKNTTACLSKSAIFHVQTLQAQESRKRTTRERYRIHPRTRLSESETGHRFTHG